MVGQLPALRTVEYDTLQELHKRSIVQTKTNISTAVQTEDSESHVRSHNQIDHKDKLINIDDVSKNSRICALESSKAVKTAESHEKTHEHVTVGQNKADGSSDDLLSETPT
ncbi:hypothetical protein XENOCAPTIV_022020 [Xenoophorus captivus]|uniref:Uncharacterized protein n=1 Tax=Xenoophorus captivus TaxID=1517983 RepID=A0ABV0S997_9TELE